MDVGALAVVTAALFAWGVLSRRIQRADMTAPIVFLALGALLAGIDVVHGPTAVPSVKMLVELTLVLVLFSDAARVSVPGLRRDSGPVLRLLAIGLPATVLIGWGLAKLLFPGFDWWWALLVGAALAPTDAALGVPVVTNPAVPERIRRLITVESGLNDGIATPVVLFALAGAATVEGELDAPTLPQALLELALGALVGVLIGAAGGALLRWARHRRWADDDFVGPAVLSLAVLSYAAALAVDGNGFVAAFCAGAAFGATAGRRGPHELVFLEQASSLMSLVVWLVFGAVVSSVVVSGLGWAAVGYAVLSLTLVRMLPVALSLVGTGMDSRTVAFIGWFGPRGLASLVFALLAIEALGPGADDAVAVIGLTVTLSVLAHGLSSAPLAAAYGRRSAPAGAEGAEIS